MYRIYEHVSYVRVKVTHSDGQFVRDLDANTKCRDKNLARIRLESDEQ
jgi:hypothetical protein